MKNEADIAFEKRGRKLVWHDEFDGETLDFDKWCFTQHMTNPGCVYDNSARNVRIEDGKLFMQVHRLDDTYTLCSSVSTQKTMNFKYGYLEMRARIPFRHGAWPSLWMKTDTPFRKKESKFGAEIDIFEVFSSPDTLIYNLHKWGFNGKHLMLPGGEGGMARSYTFDNPETVNNEYHTYGFEWDKHYMSFYVDDKKYAYVPIDENGNFGSDVIEGVHGFHDFAYLIINNEIFTDKLNWYPEGSAMTPEDETPINYYVDWVRLYQKGDEESFYCKKEIEECANSIKG